MVESLRASSTFLGSWLRYMDHQETHPLMDLWAGLWVLSNVVGPDVQVTGPSGPIPLNLYVMFVAESGRVRKSTGVNRAVDLLRRTGTSGTWITRGRSPQKILRETKSPHLIFAGSELVTLLGKSAVAYALPAMLTDLYDCPRSTGMETCLPDQVRLFPTFIGASAPSWLVGSINTDVLGGGFSSRLMVVTADRGKGLRPWPDNLVDDTDALKELNHVVARLSDPVLARGSSSDGDGDALPVHRTGTQSLNLERDAVETYQRLYIRQSREDHLGSYLGSFYSRWSTHTLKAGALLAINRGARTIDREDLERADVLTRTAAEHGDQVFSKGQGDNLLRSLETVKRVLVQQGTNLITQTELTKRLRTRPTGLRNILDTLHELDMIQVVEVKAPKGRPTLMYRATTRMLEVSSEQVARLLNRSPP